MDIKPEEKQEVLETIDVTARLIANQASLKTRTDAVQAAVGRLREAASS